MATSSCCPRLAACWTPPTSPGWRKSRRWRPATSTTARSGPGTPGGDGQEEVGPRAALIAGKTLAVIGVGSLGAAVAHHAKRLGLRVLGVSRHGQSSPDLDESHTTEALDQVLLRADYVFVATPLTPETRGLLDRRRFDLMKPAAGLVNVGRAAVVDTDALADKLRDGSLAGAILDVFDPEPLPADSPLWDVPNLILTPHVSADDGASYVPLTLDLFFDNMARYLAGEPLRNEVSAELGY